MNVEVVSYRGEKTRFQGNDLRNCTKFVVVMHIVCTKNKVCSKYANSYFSLKRCNDAT